MRRQSADYPCVSQPYLHGICHEARIMEGASQRAPGSAKPTARAKTRVTRSRDSKDRSSMIEDSAVADRCKHTCLSHLTALHSFSFCLPLLLSSQGRGASPRVEARPWRSAWLQAVHVLCVGSQATLKPRHCVTRSFDRNAPKYILLSLSLPLCPPGSCPN